MIVATPLLLRRMGTSDFGLWQISLAAFGLLGVLELGLGTAVSKYVAEHAAQDDLTSLSATATVALTGYVVIGAVLTPILFLGAGPIALLFSSHGQPQGQIRGVVQLVALGLMPLLLLSGGLGIAIGLQRFEIPMLAAMAQNGLTLVTATCVAYAGGSVHGVVLSSLVVLWLVAAGAIVWALRALRRLGAQPLWTVFHARRTFSYVGITSLTSLGTAVFGTVDRLAVGAVLGLRAVTYYAVSIGIASKLLAIADVGARPLMPASSARIGANDPGGVRRTLIRWTRGVAVFTWLAAISILLLSEPFLRIWAGPVFADHALTTFRVLVVIYAFIALAAPAYHVANGVGQPSICAASALVGGGLTIALIFVLGPRLGVVGAAWANAAYVVNLAIPVYILNQLRRMADIPARTRLGATR